MADLDIQPPAFHGLAGNQYSAARLRRFLQTVIGDREGVHLYGDLRVTANTPAAMNVLVATGRGLVNGDEVTRQGAYLLEQATTITLPIASNSSGQPRVDLIVLRDYDAASDGGSASADKGTVEVVQGTPAASPVPPTVPTSAIPLAQVTVASGASSIVAANIADRRIPLAMANPVSCMLQDTTVRSGLTSGQQLTLSTSPLDTFALTGVSPGSRILLLPQEPRAMLWRFSCRVTLGQAMANPFSLVIGNVGVDKIIGSSVTRGPDANSQPVITTAGWLLTSAAASASNPLATTRSLQAAIVHTESGGVTSVSSAGLEATYIGPVG